MKYLITRFFPLKALQRQKIYLQRGLYNPCNTKIRNFICRIDEMVEYLGKFSPYGVGQRLHDDEILNLVEISLPMEWKNNQSSKVSIPQPRDSRISLTSAKS